MSELRDMLELVDGEAGVSYACPGSVYNLLAALVAGNESLEKRLGPPLTGIVTPMGGPWLLASQPPPARDEAAKTKAAISLAKGLQEELWKYQHWYAEQMAGVQKAAERSDETIRVLRAARVASEKAYDETMEKIVAAGRYCNRKHELYTEGLRKENGGLEGKIAGVRAALALVVAERNSLSDQLATCEDGSNGAVGSGVGTT